MTEEELKLEIRRAIHNSNTVNGAGTKEEQLSQAASFEIELADRIASAIHSYVQTEIIRRLATLPANLICAAPGSPVTPSPTYYTSIR